MIKRNAEKTHADLMKHVFAGPLENIQERNRREYYGHPALIPGMTPEIEHACLAEIRSMRYHLTPWKKMPNGMVAGQFAFLYLHHFKQRRRPIHHQ